MESGSLGRLSAVCQQCANSCLPLRPCFENQPLVTVCCCCPAASSPLPRGCDCARCCCLAMLLPTADLHRSIVDLHVLLVPLVVLYRLLHHGHTQHDGQGQERRPWPASTKSTRMLNYRTQLQLQQDRVDSFQTLYTEPGARSLTTSLCLMLADTMDQLLSCAVQRWRLAARGGLVTL